jgi:exodeoxyribonuclease VII small subunit
MDMAERKQKDETTKLTFEQAIGQLKEIVTRIEQGQIALQDSLDQYEKGMALIKHCRDILQKAEKRIEKIAKEEPSEPPPQEDDPEPLLRG